MRILLRVCSLALCAQLGCGDALPEIGSMDGSEAPATTATPSPEGGEELEPASNPAPELDSDGDGVPDENDLCAGFDDAEDANGNGEPDGCEFVVAGGMNSLVELVSFQDGDTPVDLRNLEIGDRLVFELPEFAARIRQVDEGACTCLWSVEPQTAGSFDPTDECTTTYTVEGVGAAVLRVLQTCNGRQRGFAQGVSASEPSVAATPALEAVIVTSPEPAAGEDCLFDACVLEGETVTLDGTKSVGSEFTPLTHAWRQTQGPPTPLKDPNDFESDRCCDPAEDESLSNCTDAGICALGVVAFRAPDVEGDDEVELTFELTVSVPDPSTGSSAVSSETASASILVRNIPEESPPPSDDGGEDDALPVAVCGNGVMDVGEACDDNFADACGTCNADCTGPGTVSTCGDGEVCPETETCDDGFTDGCGSCNATCSGAGAGSTCGDVDLCAETETCDDGFTDACGSCNADCSGPGNDSTCGDGDPCPETEECDDGNIVSGDGCDEFCMLEPLPDCRIDFESNCPSANAPQCGASFSGGGGCRVIGIGACYSSGIFSYEATPALPLTIMLDGNLNKLTVFFSGQDGGGGTMTFFDVDGVDVDTPIMALGDCATFVMPDSQTVTFSRPVRRIEVAATSPVAIWIDDFHVNPP